MVSALRLFAALRLMSLASFCIANCPRRSASFVVLLRSHALTISSQFCKDVPAIQHSFSSGRVSIACCPWSKAKPIGTGVLNAARILHQRFQAVFVIVAPARSPAPLPPMYLDMVRKTIFRRLRLREARNHKILKIPLCSAVSSRNCWFRLLPGLLVGKIHSRKCP